MIACTSDPSWVQDLDTCSIGICTDAPYLLSSNPFFFLFFSFFYVLLDDITKAELSQNKDVVGWRYILRRSPLPWDPCGTEAAAWVRTRRLRFFLTQCSWRSEHSLIWHRDNEAERRRTKVLNGEQRTVREGAEQIRNQTLSRRHWREQRKDHRPIK